MNHIHSKITSKSQTVIPREVRELLGVGPGDRLTYTKTGNGVVIAKAKEQPEDDPFAVFSEWNSANDDKAYRDL
jgi:antitoxin PrlF